jgi:sugar lactone lactonase YvrE
MARSVNLLAEGFYFGEGPRWRDGRLWFSDFYSQRVVSVSPAGDLRTEVAIDDQPSGLGWLPDGSLLIVSMTKRQVLRRSPDGAIDVHADLGAIADFHCNDMVVGRDGWAYVGNFGFDLDAAIAADGVESVVARHPTAKLACVSPTGAVSVAATELHFPNGSVITPNGKTLIVAETLGGGLTAFSIGEEGRLSDRRVWASTGSRVPDGIALNANGAIWVANALAPECALFAEGGKVLDVIATGDPCYACMLGGEDGRTLFMLTAPSSNHAAAAASPKGKLLTSTVDAPHAGLP